MWAFIRKGKNFIVMLADTDSLAIHFNQRNIIVRKIQLVNMIRNLEPGVLFGQCV